MPPDSTATPPAPFTAAATETTAAPGTWALADRLRVTTRPWHTRVERSGVMQDLLRGRLSRPAYAVLLRNLYAVYQALETAIEEAQAAPAPSPVVWPALVPPVLLRSAALQSDLLLLHGPAWRDALPVARAATAYAQHLQGLAITQPLLLAAHAYVRYLGDLNGGQMLARLLGQHLSLGADGLAFYRFETDATVQQLQARFKRALEPAGSNAAAAQALVDEACSAFARHETLFEELQGLLPQRGL